MEPELTSMIHGMNHEWFALQVRSRWEVTTGTLLQNKGLQVLAPTYTTRRRWSDRYKTVEEPLFPGYVFCRFDLHNRLPVLITPGVIAVVGIGKTPISVDPAEIHAIESMVRSKIQAQPWPYLEIGERVKIRGTALDGVEGILTNLKGAQRVVISVTLLRRSVALEIDRSQIMPIASPRPASAGSIGRQAFIGQAV